MSMSKTVTSAILTVSSLAAETRSSLSSPVNLIQGGGAVQLALWVSVGYQATTKQPLILEVYGSLDGIVFDTFPFFAPQVPNAIPAGGGAFTTRVSFPVDASMAYIGVSVYNSDPTLTVASVSVKAIVHSVV